MLLISNIFFREERHDKLETSTIELHKVQKRVARFNLRVAQETHEANIKERRERQQCNEEIRKAQLEFYTFLTDSIKSKNAQ